MRLNLLLILISIVLLPQVAFATTIPQTIRLVLPNDGSEYNLNAGSSFDSVNVSNTYFTFVLVAGDSLELISPDKKNLSNDASPAVSTICNTGDSRLVLSVPTGGSTKTVVVTPSGSCSSGSSTGGGGSPSIGQTVGGGGGGGSYSPPPAPAPQPVPAPAPAPVPQVQTIVSPTQTSQTSAVFTQDLFSGQTNDDVTRLQTLLAQDSSVYPEGKVTGYFGPATLRAVKRFQEKYGLSPVGRVGPQTRAKLAEIFGGSALPPPAPSPVPTTGMAIPEQDVSFGESGEDISRLQTLLAQDSSVYPEGKVTGYFGPATLRAVKRFQDKYGIPGTGKAGPLTRQKLQELYGGSSSMMAPSPMPAPSMGGSDAAAAQALQDQIKKIQEQILQLQIQQVQEKINAVQP